MSEPVAHLVQVQQLTRVYRAGARQVHALQGVDLTVGRGEFVALRGRSGSGKTTLLNCIGGLDTPTSGQVFVEGHNVAQLPEEERTALRRRIGFVFQSFALLPTFSAWENVDLALRIAGVDARQRRARIQECLSLVGLARWKDHRPYELSGGQQQRVAIARALALRPSLILADEPTGELDSATGRQIMALLRRIVDEQGSTVMIATHDWTVAEYATAVYDLHDGRIAAVAPQV
ncbi:MAG: ABC transporter ATP-binding protein [Anaerolineae bacterium]